MKGLIRHFKWDFVRLVDLAIVAEYGPVVWREPNRYSDRRMGDDFVNVARLVVKRLWWSSVDRLDVDCVVVACGQDLVPLPVKQIFIIEALLCITLPSG